MDDLGMALPLKAGVWAYSADWLVADAEGKRLAIIEDGTAVQNRARAHLFAAAPELHAALSEMLCSGCGAVMGEETMPDGSPRDAGCELCAAARAAIAKARGVVTA